ncbi:MAG: hypothetical protein GX557_06335 [Chloroflexi bacterium]|nr:hypothetical protein [Chloroflexota bacterium]
MNRTTWMPRRMFVVCVVVSLVLLVLTGCGKEQESTPEGETTIEQPATVTEGLVGDWQLKHRGTDIVSKVTLALAADGTFIHLGQRGEQVDNGTYTFEGDELRITGGPCSGSSGLKVDPCVGVYKVEKQEEGGAITAITLQLVEDPSLGRSLDFGGQEFVRTK